MKIFLPSFFLLIVSVVSAQPKPFYKEAFTAGVLPEGWYVPPAGKWDPRWEVTNQPYPGSYGYQQQAPPIASASRGYHLQFAAGYYTDEDVDSWASKNKYPDANIVSAPVNCSGKSSVILRFQHTFRWWNYKPADSTGLFVGVSTDGSHWKEWDMRKNVKPSADMFTPIKEEINITSYAAGQPGVYLRFYWKGLQAWYWMIDDIELSEAAARDMGIVQLSSHSESGNHFKENDTLRVVIRNNGAQPVTTPVVVNATVDGDILDSVIIKNGLPIQSGEERTVDFSGINLARKPLHSLMFTVATQGDEVAQNNRLVQTITNEKTVLGNLSSWKKLSNGAELISGSTTIKVLFYKPGLFRIWLAPDGEYINPAGNDIVIDDSVYDPAVSYREDARKIYLTTAACQLQIQKSPVLFSMYNNKKELVWAEKEPLSFGGKTVQHLSRAADEYFYGGGMQNGYFSHRDSTIRIEKGGGWDNGGRPNPAPFYMSSKGYGALRNTFDIGVYEFTRNMLLSHNENRFDCYYFAGPSLKDILNQYTALTGRPFMPARWQLSLGDANCYNKKGTTPDVIKLVANEYVKHDMPRGWILPNDGYGCGYTKLDSTVRELKKLGFYTGLWTENGVEKIATEVGTYGTRLCKLDVAWVGPGYKYALDGCKAAFNGIEANSNSRGFVWSVMGWAGTQRYSVMWTGDQSGNWEYIRFHIPTVIGSGLSGQNCATGDVDGIFGGSAKTYVRDLQWKCFTPVFMTMSGWAKKDKQPWIWGEPYTAINRKYLQLKMRLTPYMYTLMQEANTTGVPAVRGLLLEYPKDSVTWGKTTQYEYLLGKSFLVAPVYKDEEKRDSIYLPEGTWTDYWNGAKYSGKQWLSNYAAPLDKLPLFVKSGSIIPMYPQMNYDGEKPFDSLTLDIYPLGNTSFTLYEDDGSTREYKLGAFATTQITAVQGASNLTVNIYKIKGDYAGMLKERNYLLQIHTGKPASAVYVNGRKASNGSYDQDKKLLLLNCGTWSVAKDVKIVIK